MLSFMALMIRSVLDRGKASTCWGVRYCAKWYPWASGNAPHFSTHWFCSILPILLTEFLPSGMSCLLLLVSHSCRNSLRSFPGGATGRGPSRRDVGRGGPCNREDKSKTYGRAGRVDASSGAGDACSETGGGAKGRIR